MTACYTDSCISYSYSKSVRMSVVLTSVRPSHAGMTSHIGQGRHSHGACRQLPRTNVF